MPTKQRAFFFVDGSNWYHSLKDAGVASLGELDYGRICRKLATGARDWIGTRYYIGRVTQTQDRRLYAGQRRFISRLEGDDEKIQTLFGRLEPRATQNDAAAELDAYLDSLGVRIDKDVFRELKSIAGRHGTATVYVEKAVDVMIALDLAMLAEKNAFDAAYLLSADGDYTPAVKIAREAGKSVFAVSCDYGARLAEAANGFIRLDADWFSDCYRD